MGDLQVSPTPLFLPISTHLHTARALYTQPSRLPVPVGRHPGHCLLVTAPSAHHTTPHHTTPHCTAPCHATPLHGPRAVPPSPCVHGHSAPCAPWAMGSPFVHHRPTVRSAHWQLLLFTVPLLWAVSSGVFCSPPHRCGLWCGVVWCAEGVVTNMAKARMSCTRENAKWRALVLNPRSNRKPCAPEAGGQGPSWAPCEPKACLGMPCRSTR